MRATTLGVRVELRCRRGWSLDSAAACISHPMRSACAERSLCSMITASYESILATVVLRRGSSAESSSLSGFARRL